MANFFHLVLYRPLFNLMVWIVAFLPGHNLGIAIIVLTLLVRLLLYRFSLSSLVTQVKMQEIQPIINNLKETYKGDQKKQSEEIMRLYKEEKVNPAGGCLPLLIQLPVLIVLYSVFRTNLTHLPTSELYPFVHPPSTIGTSFLGLDLTNAERVHWPLDGHAVGLLVLAVVSALLQLWQLKMIQPKTTTSSPGAPDPTRQMLYMMPAISFIIALSLPAALPLYWIVTTFFTIAQQYWFFNRGKLKAAETVPVMPEDETPMPTITSSRPPEVVHEKKRDVNITIRKKS